MPISPRCHTRPLLITALALPLVFLAACGGGAAPAAAPPAKAAVKNGGPARHTGRPASAGHAGQGTGRRSASRATRTSGDVTGAHALAGAASPAATLAGCPMFPSDNVWNTDISKLPVDSHSNAWLKSMNSYSAYLHPDFGPDAGGYPYGIPYTVVTSSHPKVPIHFQYASESNKGPYPFGYDTRIEGGKAAGGDRHALMLDRSTCTLYELWNARYGSHPTAGSGAIWNLRSNALRPAGWTSADAAGLPILPGLLNYGQVRRAAKTGVPIRHAIRFTAARTAGSYIWPARHEAGSGSVASLPPMGARFRLKLSFNVAGYCGRTMPYCGDAKAVLTEMQHYGLILADNGSNWYFGGASFPQWPSGLVELLKNIPAKDFQAVNESCLMVARNSGQARARQGCPAG
ncbi:MAG TPA: hypothetical protein VF843_06020 [Streptosporangiaceae bacterium]